MFSLTRPRPYRRKAPLVLVNGLAEQSESWFANRRHWDRHFDVKTPELLVYDGESLHRRIRDGGAIDVAYLTDRLALYLDEFVQRPPYHLAGSSLGGQVAVSYALRHPGKVGRLVLLCPSGFHGDERLPVLDGVRRSRSDTLVNSVFHRRHGSADELADTIGAKFQDRLWKKGVLRTLRGTVGHSVEARLPDLRPPTLVLWGDEDRILSDVPGSVRAAARIPGVTQAVLPRCGHAPQIEQAARVNRLVTRFLLGRLDEVPPALDAARYLARQAAGPGVATLGPV